MKSLTLTHGVLLAATLLGPSAYAIDGKGNGGIVQVCRDSDQNIQSIELLDLWRARHHEQTVTSTETDASKIWENAFSKLPLSYETQTYLQGLYETAKDYAVQGPVGKALDSTDDGIVAEEGEERPVADAGCSFEQLANFTEGGALIVQPELYAAIRRVPLQYAAFLLHEPLYRHGKVRLENSLQVQKLVAAILSPSEDQALIRSLTGKVLGVGALHEGGPEGKITLIHNSSPVRLSGFDSHSKEPITIEVKNISNVWKVFEGWSQNRLFRGEVGIKMGNGKVARLKYVDPGLQETAVVEFPYSGENVAGTSIVFQIFADSSKRLPECLITVKQGQKTLGSWNATELSPSVKAIEFNGGFQF